jgi:ferric-dicitrate binding protein FerR (iron transport regulator)
MHNQDIKLDEPLRSLIEAVVNGEASAEQHRQLEQLLLEDERARDAWLNYVNLHAALGRRFLSSDSAQTLADDDIADFALFMSREGMTKHSRRRGYVAWLGMAVAVCLLLVVGFYPSPWFRSFSDLKMGESPLIVQLTGDVTIQAADGSTMAATGRRTVQPGETVITEGDESRVALRYADGTGIVLLGASTLTVDDPPRGGKQLHLKAGLLQADVAPQPAAAPLSIITPQARVRVLGTRFELSADEHDGTRLDLATGRVELVRGNEKPINVEPNSIAIVPTTRDPIRVSPRPAIVDTPQRETSFGGLRSVAFADDGKTLVAATRWQAVYWYPDDRMEVIPLSVHGSKGIDFRQQMDSLLAYSDGREQKLVVWDAESRQSLRVFEDAAELPSQFRPSPERPENWNPVSNIAVVPSHGNWLVFQVGREFRVWRAGNDRWPKFPRNYDGKFVAALAASPDGETLAIALRRDRVDLVDLKSGEVATTWSMRKEVPFAMEFSADGRRLAVALAGHVEVRDAVTGDLIADFRQPGLPFIKVAISADGRFVAAASPGDHVWMWDAVEGAELPLLDVGESIQDLAFAPGSDRLAVLSHGGRLTVWKVAVENPGVRD